MAEENMDNQDVKYESLILELADDWLVSDFELLLNIINNVYQTYYAINDIKQSHKKVVKDKLLGLIESTYKDMMKMKYQQKEVISKPEVFPTLIVQTPIDYYIGLADTIVKGSWYITVQEQLKINKIAIASPGHIDFKGIAEVIREVRELIKDLSFRNKQERINGEIDIMERTVKMLEGFNVPRQEAAKIAMNLINNGKLIGAFYDKGHIIDISA